MAKTLRLCFSAIKHLRENEVRTSGPEGHLSGMRIVLSWGTVRTKGGLRASNRLAGRLSCGQEILDADRNIAFEQAAGTFEYHPEHNHWHIGDVAQFEVRVGSATGPILLNDRGESVSIKTTFCLIDWYQLEGNSNTKERLYWDCATSFQGIAPGWVDQYHQSLDGQKVDITGVDPGLYYLVSTANPARRFLEMDYTNNTAWTSFKLTRDSKGNAKIEIVGNSPCDTPGLCGVGAPNR